MVKSYYDTKSIPEMAIDTRLLLQRLLQAKVGEVITYQDLNGQIDRDVQREANPCLQSAMRSALRQMMVFSTIRGVGVKRLTDRELAGIGDATRQHISRSARMAMRKMAAVQDFDTLNNEEKVRHNTNLAMLGAVAHIASPNQMKTLEGRVTANAGVLPVQRTLAAFMGKEDEAVAETDKTAPTAEKTKPETRTQSRKKPVWDFSKDNLA
jgi:hypothetical protein